MNHKLLKAIDPLARMVGLHTSYTVSEKEFVGSVEINTSNIFAEKTNPPFVMENDFYNYLMSIGYEKLPTFAGISLEAAKEHPNTGRVHDVSLRKVAPDPQKQYHLHYWAENTAGDGYEAQIAVHKEYRPDITRVGEESIGDALKRLRTHYKPDWETSEYQRGKMDPKLKELLGQV